MLSLVVKLMIVFHLQVESIVLSIISMLSSPNDESPANIEAAVSSDNLLYTVLITDLYLWDSTISKYFMFVSYYPFCQY
jgi:hypothetical protein